MNNNMRYFFIGKHFNILSDEGKLSEEEFSNLDRCRSRHVTDVKLCLRKGARNER